MDNSIALFIIAVILSGTGLLLFHVDEEVHEREDIEYPWWVTVGAYMLLGGIFFCGMAIGLLPKEVGNDLRDPFR